MNRLNGIADKNARFVEHKQLMDREYWRLFVDQFKKSTDDADNGWRCEYFGKMMRGASVTYSYTGNEELYSVLTDAAKDMLSAQDCLGRFSSYSLAKEFFGWDMWGRKYVLLGFLAYCEICRDEKLKADIMTALTKHLDYIVANIGKGKRELGTTSDFWKCVNSASILEPTLIMYRKTNKKEYLEFAEYIIEYLFESDACIFKCAEENLLYPFEYPVNKAYEVMSCFEGLLEYYELTGEKRYLNTVLNFAERLLSSDITIIGCAGCHEEQLDNAKATQTDPDYTGIMQETCVTVTWMKLCHRLLRVTDDSRWADEIERSAYNALYGAVNTENRKNIHGENFAFDSYSPLLLNKRGRLVGGYKELDGVRHYGCCVAIGAHGTGMLPLYAMRATDSFTELDFYEKGTLSANGFELEISTEYPLDGHISVRLTAVPEGEATLRFRIPYFTASRYSAKLNDMPLTTTQGFLSVTREWHTGDTLIIDFDMSPRIIHPVGVKNKPSSKKFVAVMYGPLVMARDKRLGNIGKTVPASESIDFTLCDSPDFHCELAAEVGIGGVHFKLIDYMSAGKTWDDDSLTEVWLPTE